MISSRDYFISSVNRDLSVVKLIQYFYSVISFTASSTNPIAITFLCFLVEEIYFPTAQRTRMRRFIPQTFQEAYHFISATHFKLTQYIFFHNISLPEFHLSLHRTLQIYHKKVKDTGNIKPPLTLRSKVAWISSCCCQFYSLCKAYQPLKFMPRKSYDSSKLRSGQLL